MLPAVVSLSAIFAFGSLAQQEEGQVNDKVRELQEQYRRLLKNEYNPSTIEPKTNGKPSFSESGWMKSSKRAKGKKSKHGKYAKKKSGTRRASKKTRSGKKLAKGRSGKLARNTSKRHPVKGTALAKASAGKRPKSSRASAPKAARSSVKGAKSSGKTAKKTSKSRVSEKKKKGTDPKVAVKKGTTPKSNKIVSKKKNK